MTELDKVGIITDECDHVWGSKGRYPTREAFVKAANHELDMEIRPEDVTTVYMRRAKSMNGFDPRWRVCRGPARGATPAWEGA